MSEQVYTLQRMARGDLSHQLGSRRGNSRQLRIPWLILISLIQLFTEAKAAEAVRDESIDDDMEIIRAWGRAEKHRFAEKSLITSRMENSEALNCMCLTRPTCDRRSSEPFLTLTQPIS